MICDTKNLISITEANQNFSQVAKNVELNGEVVILKNNKPKYVLSKFDQNKGLSEMEMLTVVAKLILTEHIKAFKELAQ